MALTKADREELRRQHPQCYVCSKMGVPHADLMGYEQRAINFDHWLAKGLVGDRQEDLKANQRPIHADTEGLDPLDAGWESAVRRNCHRGKGNKFTGEEWCEYISIYQAALKTRYSDDLLADRNRQDAGYDVEVGWSPQSGTAQFSGKEYPLMTQRVSGEEWHSFSTVLSPWLLWTDHEVQSRPASAQRITAFAWHLRKSPLLTPILCRWSESRLKVFDGNHRLCAFILARPNDPVPITVFDGPDPSRFLAVVGEAHDTLTQMKYQYTDKALKFSALNEKELQDAMDKYKEQASEELAWRGMSRKDAALRIRGRLSARLDDGGGWRLDWKEQGVTDPSWNQFLATYAKIEAEVEPFSSAAYLREEEIENLCMLCQIFEDELFARLPTARDSLKTKWWKRAHVRFAKGLATVLKVHLKLPNTPDCPAYTPKWDDYILVAIRKAAEQWRESPAWRDSTTANNEKEIDRLLNDRDFNESYLFN